MRFLSPILASAFTLVMTSPAIAQTEEIQQSTNDLLVFKKHLGTAYPDKKWQTGPSRLDSRDVQTAYPGRRFYFVFSSPPLPPGAFSKQLQEDFRRRSEEFRKSFISVTVSIDGADALKELREANDFNQGLMKVKSDEDARTAAAAILSLYGSGRVGPGPVAAKDLTGAASDKGWSWQVRTRFFHGSVTLDANGQCTAVSKVYTGPLPP
jgi:hypothetical protein